MTTSQQLVLSENFNFAIWLQADIQKPDDIRSGCLNSLSALSKIKQQFAADNVDMTLAFGSDFWQSLNHKEEGRELKNFPAYGNGKAAATQCDLLIHIQSLSFMANFALLQAVLSAFGDSITVKSEEQGYRLADARGIDGFVDGTENPHEISKIKEIGTIADNQPDAGGSYIVVQKYQHNLPLWQSYSIEKQEESVGRSKAENIEFSREQRHARSHLSRTNLKENGVGLKIVRRSLPYGKATGECGLIFCAYCHSLYNIEKQLQTMFGDIDGQTDFLLERLSRAVSGAYYFAPSIERLRNL